MCCNLEGNAGDTFDDDFISSSVEMDVLESAVQEIHGSPRDGEAYRILSLSLYLLMLHCTSTSLFFILFDF